MKRENIMAIRNEFDLERYFAFQLDKMGIFSLHLDATGRKGYPDRQVFWHIVFYVELKSGLSNHKQTPMQRKWQEKFTRSNALYLLLENRAQVDALLDYIRAQNALYPQAKWQQDPFKERLSTKKPPKESLHALFSRFTPFYAND